RFVRKTGDLARMDDWAKEHEVALVSATETFDTSTPLGKAIATIIAVFAEMESAATAERVTGTHKYLRQVGRWAGGTPPYGYRAAPNGNGWQLVIDDQAAGIVREAVRRVIARESMLSVVKDFNARGILAPRGGAWNVQSLSLILRSPALLGQ